MRVDNNACILAAGGVGMISNITLPAWRYHLQQMVLEENPIQYLKRFL